MIGRQEVDPKKSSVLRQSRRPFSSPSFPAEPNSVSPDDCNISSAKLAARLEKTTIPVTNRSQVGNLPRVTRLSGLPSQGAECPQGSPALVSRNPGQEYSEKSPIQPIRCSPLARHPRQKPGVIRGGTVPVCTQRRTPTHPAS